jgi:DNA repair exonuclease SbcCD ATPase subunit
MEHQHLPQSFADILNELKQVLGQVSQLTGVPSEFQDRLNVLTTRVSQMVPIIAPHQLNLLPVVSTDSVQHTIPPPEVLAPLMLHVNALILRVNQLEQELGHMKEERGRLALENESLRNQLQLYQRSHQEMADMKSSHERDCRNLEDEIRRLHEENEQLRKALQALEQDKLALSSKVDQLLQQQASQRALILVGEACFGLEWAAKRDVFSDMPTRKIKALRIGIAEIERQHQSDTLGADRSRRWEAFKNTKGVTDDVIDTVAILKQQRTDLAHALLDKATGTMVELQEMVYSALDNQGEDRSYGDSILAALANVDATVAFNSVS